MSGKHFSRSSEVAHLVAEVNRSSAEELLEIYGIELDPLLLKYKQGIVFDTLYDKFFKTVHEWAAFTVDQEHIDDEYDDEYSKYDDEDA